jgi:hypothetical protein
MTHLQLLIEPDCAGADVLVGQALRRKQSDHRHIRFTPLPQCDTRGAHATGRHKNTRVAQREQDTQTTQSLHTSG